MLRRALVGLAGLARSFTAPSCENMAQMPVRYVRSAQIAHPTGDPSFAVQQSMPSAVPQDESDPFLMCDEFGPAPSKGAYGTDSDKGFYVGWHPHHGMDILSYFVAGNGRHADSMGNREIFRSPGFQWLSVGSGIEHAEGGGTPRGETEHGFQIWLRMPAARMGDAPRYGTVEPEGMTTVALDDRGSLARVIAGPFRDAVGPAKFAVTVQMLDVDLKPGAVFERPRGAEAVLRRGPETAAPRRAPRGGATGTSGRPTWTT